MYQRTSRLAQSNLKRRPLDLPTSAAFSPRRVRSSAPPAETSKQQVDAVSLSAVQCNSEPLTHIESSQFAPTPIPARWADRAHQQRGQAPAQCRHRRTKGRMDRGAALPELYRSLTPARQGLPSAVSRSSINEPARMRSPSTIVCYRPATRIGGIHGC